MGNSICALACRIPGAEAKHECEFDALVKVHGKIEQAARSRKRLNLAGHLAAVLQMNGCGHDSAQANPPRSLLVQSRLASDLHFEETRPCMLRIRAHDHFGVLHRSDHGLAAAAHLSPVVFVGGSRRSGKFDSAARFHRLAATRNGECNRDGGAVSRDSMRHRLVPALPVGEPA